MFSYVTEQKQSNMQNVRMLEIQLVWVFCLKSCLGPVLFNAGYKCTWENFKIKWKDGNSPFSICKTFTKYWVYHVTGSLNWQES